MKFKISERALSYNRLLLLFLFLILISTTFDMGFDSAYFSFACIFVLFPSHLLIKDRLLLKFDNINATFLILSFLVFLSWIYGFFSGLVNEVEFSYVIRNFAGLLLYLLIPLLMLVKPSVASLFRVVVLAGLVQIFDGLSKLYQSGFSIENLAYNSSLSVLRIVYSTGFIVIFPLFMFSILRVFIGAQPFYYKAACLVIFSLSCIVLILVTMSKGFILASFFLLFAVFIYFLLRAMIHFRVNVMGMAYQFVFISITIFVIYLFGDILSFSFSSQETSNAIRSEQAGYLISEFSFLGSGLGSSLKSGFVRDQNFPYGFELTYLNLIHKLGFFSFALFSLYVVTIWTIMLRLWKNERALESFFCLGLVAFMIVGAGNPLLLSPIAVTLHSIAVYILCANQRFLI